MAEARSYASEGRTVAADSPEHALRLLWPSEAPELVVLAYFERVGVWPVLLKGRYLHAEISEV